MPSSGAIVHLVCQMLFGLSVLNFGFRLSSFVAQSAGVGYPPTGTAAGINKSTMRRGKMNSAAENNKDAQEHERKGERLLYIVTSIAEFDNGKRNTKRGFDRFGETLLPILRDSVASLTMASSMAETAEPQYQVDVYLICHYVLTPQRRQQLVTALESVATAKNGKSVVSIGLQVWDDATPLGYALEHSTNRIQDVTRGLARQHRYVIKDKFLEYDMVLSFEDDMVVHAGAVRYFQSTTDQLARLRQNAPAKLVDYYSVDEMHQHFYGGMTQKQLARCIPGFIRVEVALEAWHAKHPAGSVEDENTRMIDKTSCCELLPENAGPRRPQAPTSIDDLLYWETTRDALGIRQMPPQSSAHKNINTTTRDLDWVILQAGNNEAFYDDPSYIIGRYAPRSTTNNGAYQAATGAAAINNQGGWMGTRQQIWEWHTQRCLSSFLPPYNPSVYERDGLDQRSVEYWSGGISLIGVHACNLQRIIPMAPEAFGKALLYHASNNKQGQSIVQARSPSRSIGELYRQLEQDLELAKRTKEQEMAELGG